MKKLIVSAALVFMLMIPITVAAQGCALCYTQAHASGPRMIQALNDGILVLMFPPMGICLVIIVMAYKKRDKFFRRQPHARHEGPHADLGW